MCVSGLKSENEVQVVRVREYESMRVLLVKFSSSRSLGRFFKTMIIFLWFPKMRLKKRSRLVCAEVHVTISCSLALRQLSANLKIWYGSVHFSHSLHVATIKHRFWKLQDIVVGNRHRSHSFSHDIFNADIEK